MIEHYNILKAYKILPNIFHVLHLGTASSGLQRPKGKMSIRD